MQAIVRQEIWSMKRLIFIAHFLKQTQFHPVVVFRRGEFQGSILAFFLLKNVVI